MKMTDACASIGDALYRHLPAACFINADGNHDKRRNPVSLIRKARHFMRDLHWHPVYGTCKSSSAMNKESSLLESTALTGGCRMVSEVSAVN